MKPADEPRSVFQQRRCELRRRDHFFDVLVGDGCATLAAGRVADGDDGERVWIREPKQRVARLPATDLHFAFDETGVFESLDGDVAWTRCCR
jgi:hypothetical protein